jgi:hypothetical protein
MTYENFYPNMKLDVLNNEKTVIQYKVSVLLFIPDSTDYALRACATESSTGWIPLSRGIGGIYL